RRRGRAPRADASFEPLLRRRGRPRGADDLPEHGRAQGLRYDRRPRRAAPRAPAGEGRRAHAARREGGRVVWRGDTGMTRMVQVAMAGDVTEAEGLETSPRAAG